MEAAGNCSFFLMWCRRAGGTHGGGAAPFYKWRGSGRERDGRGPERPLPEGGMWGKGGFGGAGDTRHGPPISAVKRTDFEFLTSKLVAEKAFFKIFGIYNFGK